MKESLEYVKGKKISLKNHPEFDESWLRDVIAKDPSIIGLPEEVILRDVERIQPSAGRLDLLLQATLDDKRYEVEIMLGAVNESHIIRTIEYWDIERKRYPNYDHCAVLIAEDITSRFLNVISLFNRAIPMIAIQMNAIQLSGKLLLDFVTVFDETGEDDDDPIDLPSTDRAYWVNRSSEVSMEAADECLKVLKEINENLNFKYNKYYIGLIENKRPNNFVVFKARPKFLRFEIRTADLETLAEKFKETKLEVVKLHKRKNRLIVNLSLEEISKNSSFLKEIFQLSYQESQE